MLSAGSGTLIRNCFLKDLWISSIVFGEPRVFGKRVRRSSLNVPWKDEPCPFLFWHFHRIEVRFKLGVRYMKRVEVLSNPGLIAFRCFVAKIRLSPVSVISSTMSTLSFLMSTFSSCVNRALPS